MSDPTPAKCACGSISWGRDLDAGSYTCVSCYRPLWQPIETAPKDGLRFLAYMGTDNIEVAHYNLECNEWWIDAYAPPHIQKCWMDAWMPLPEPPDQS